MRRALTRLELVGFKSFANRTVLEFPAGITAIVGPNGSGKSNVIDAIRWLLGEREAKNLRGGKSEDLIFAGSEKRARMSLAQASVYFDSSELKDLKDKDVDQANKLLSSEVSEISVMRQVGRDGNNQYFLNKSEVRLKDVIDFFAQARLGTKGMTVITQGNSDLFIRVSPMERRSMIEEILGLREFQIKKTDAERRLKNAQINLEKASALAEEILPHLRSLRRQTSRWEKRDELEKELIELENQFYGFRFSEIRNGLSRIEKEIEAHTSEFERLQKESHEAEARVKSLEESQPAGRKELASIRSEVQSLRDIQNGYQKEIGKLQGQIELLNRKTDTSVNVSPSALLDLTNRIKKELQSIIDSTVIGDIKASIKDLLKEIDSVFAKPQEPDNSDLTVKISNELAEMQTKYNELENKIVELRVKEEELEKGQESFYMEFRKAVELGNSIKTNIERWQNTNRERLLEKERLIMRREELENQISQSGKRPEEFKSLSIDHLAEDLGLVERKIFRLRGELASIGEVDEMIMKEAKETEERYEFLSKEVEDLNKAQVDLRTLINDLNAKIKEDFDGAFAKINDEFQKFFELMFGGGKAKMKLERRVKKVIMDGEAEAVSSQIEEEAEEEGVEVQLSLPKKRINSLEMLSGGERSLVGIAALFAMVSVSPPPFLVLDEIDAPLDERNARRFGQMLKEFSKKTQFIVVTHNRATMEAADVLYGVTLNEDGTSKVLSMKFA